MKTKFSHTNAGEKTKKYFTRKLPKIGRPSPLHVTLTPTAIHTTPLPNNIWFMFFRGKCLLGWIVNGKSVLLSLSSLEIWTEKIVVTFFWPHLTASWD